MESSQSDTRTVNREYYDAHYRSRHPLVFVLHGRLSFDQQSKRRQNERLLVRHFHNLTTSLSGKRVLDFGAGFGLLALALARHGADVHVYDWSEAGVRNLLAGGRLTFAPLHAAQEIGGRIEPGNFDLVICSHVLEHVPDDAATLRMLRGALAPGGTLLLNVPIHEQWADPKHVRSYTGQALREKVRAAGLVPLWEREGDRWTAVLLRREIDAGSSRILRIVLRTARAALSLAPERLVEWSEETFLRDVPYQQFVLLCRRDA